MNVLYLTGADGITVTVVGAVIFVAVVVVWRVAVHDRGVSKVRFGVFYERERDGDDLEPGETPRGSPPTRRSPADPSGGDQHDPPG